MLPSLAEVEGVSSALLWAGGGGVGGRRLEHGPGVGPGHSRASSAAEGDRAVGHQRSGADQRPVGCVCPPRLELDKGASEAEVVPIQLLNQTSFWKCITQAHHHLQNSFVERLSAQRSSFFGVVCF